LEEPGEGKKKRYMGNHLKRGKVERDGDEKDVAEGERKRLLEAG